MKNDKYSILHRARAKMLADSKKAKARIKRRKELLVHLATHPLPWLILTIALVYICEALKSS